MSCELLKNYDFCTITGQTVFARDLILDEATADYDLVVNISSMNFKTQHSVESLHLNRKNDTTWEWKERTEDLKPGSYDYRIIYTVGEVKRTIGQGTINVKNS